jgi:hypothetical protein
LERAIGISWELTGNFNLSCGLSCKAIENVFERYKDIKIKTVSKKHADDKLAAGDAEIFRSSGADWLNAAFFFPPVCVQERC